MTSTGLPDADSGMGRYEIRYERPPILAIYRGSVYADDLESARVEAARKFAGCRIMKVELAPGA